MTHLVMGPARPSFEEFVALRRESSIVPVTREVLADTLTPVAAYAALGGGEGSYLLESVVGGEKWARYSFVGFDPDLRVRGRGDRYEIRSGSLSGGRVETRTGVDPWKELRATLAQYRAPEVPWLPRFWGGAVGYVAYDAVRAFEPSALRKDDRRPAEEWDFSYAIGGPIVIFDSLKQTARVVLPVRSDVPDARAAYDDALARIDGVIARMQRNVALRPMSPPGPPRHDRPLPASSFDRDRFCAAVEQAKEHIRAGDIFQVVVSQRFTVPSEGVDPFDVYRAMRAINPSPYMFFLRFQECRIAGASPETLVRLEHGRAEVRPIAGTRRRGATEEDDARAAEELLADPKERAEHVMLVDLGRNDLGRVSRPGTVRLTEKMVIERYSHVMHTTSNVVGDLEPGRDALDLLAATFPAGTLSGAPKVRAMQIIDALEPEPRGIYGGAVGYLSWSGNMDVAIAIRTVVEQGGELRVQAGAGLVEASVPESEYDETVNKARAALAAIEAAKS
ncbi:Anthranilate synthase component I [Sandaracinus amylolyticus]|nr:Anthranilate synthase component I [Sandaracinus amylolyticus]